METEIQSMRVAVSCFEAESAQIPRLGGMLEVEQASEPVFCESLKIWNGSEEDVAQLQARFDELWRYPEPTQ